MVDPPKKDVCRMPLTEIAVRSSKPREKPYKLADGLGMYLLVSPNGSRLWRLKYRFGGKEKLLALRAVAMARTP